MMIGLFQKKIQTGEVEDMEFPQGYWKNTVKWAEFNHFSKFFFLNRLQQLLTDAFIFETQTSMA